MPDGQTLFVGPGARVKGQMHIEGDEAVLISENGVGYRLKLPPGNTFSSLDGIGTSKDGKPPFTLYLERAAPIATRSITPDDLAKATKASPFTNSLGMKFVPVPVTGGPKGGERLLFSMWETRVQDYDVFVRDTKPAWGSPEFSQGPTHPAVMVSWADARAFADWLTARERQEHKLPASAVYRLPTDREWSCAVGIGDRESADLIPEQKYQKVAGIFPWGQKWPPPPRSGNYWSEELRPLVGQPGFSHFKGELPG
jgi:hypothetical protein